MSKSLLSFVACLSMFTVSTTYAQRVDVDVQAQPQRRVEVDAQAQPQRRVEVRAEEPRATDRAEVRSVEAQPVGQAYRAKEVLGSKIMIEGNVSIGHVDDFVIDGDGYVEYLIVNNEGKLVTVPWEAAKFNFKDRSAMVSITQEQFKQVPTYSVDRYPTFTAPNYRVDTYRYYGLTPRERRIERRIDRRN